MTAVPPGLYILFAAIGAVPGVLALIGSFIMLGKLQQKVDGLGKLTETLPQLTTDVAYIRGLLDGKRQAAVEALTEHLSTDAPRPRRRAAA